MSAAGAHLSEASRGAGCERTEEGQRESKKTDMSKRSRKIRVALYATLALAALYFTRASWASLLIEVAAPRLARDVGLELELGDAAWDGDDRLVLSNLRVRALGERGALRKLDAVKLEAEFSLVGLLRGERGALRFASADQLELELDLGREALDETETADVDNSNGELDLPTIELTDSRALVQLANGTEVEVEELELRVENNGGEIRIDAELLDVRDANFALTPAPLSAHLALSKDQLLIHQLHWGEQLAASNSEFRFGSDDQATDEPELTWRAELVLLGAKTQLSGNLARAATSLKLAFDIVELDLASADAVWRGGPELSGQLEELTGELQIDLDQPSLSTGALRARASALQVDGSQALLLDGALTLEGGFIRSDQIELVSNENRLSITGVELPLELRDLRDQLHRGRFDLQLDARDLPALLGRSKEELRIRDHRLDLFVSLDQGIGQVHSGALVTAGGRLVVRSGTISSGDDRSPTLVLDLLADFQDLAPLGELFDDREWAGNLSGEVKVQGTWPDLSAVADLSGNQTLIAGIELGQLQLRIEADRHRILFPEVHSTNEGNELSLSGAIVMNGEEPRVEDLRFDLDINELERLLPGLAASGKLHVRGQAAGSVGELAGDWSLFAQDLRVENHVIDRFEGRGNLVGERLRVLELSMFSGGLVGKLAGDLQLDPNWSVRALDLTELSLSRGGDDLKLIQPENISFEDAWPSFRQLHLAGSAGSIRLYSRSEQSEPNQAGTKSVQRFGFRANELRPMRLLEPFLPRGYSVQLLDGELDASLTDSDLEFTSNARVEQFALPLAELTEAEFDHPWDLNWSASLTGGFLSVSAFEAVSGETSHLTLSALVPLRPLSDNPLGEGDLRIESELSLPKLEAFRGLIPADKPWPTGKLELSIDLSGTWSEPRGTIDVHAQGIDLIEGDTHLIQGARLGGRVLLADSIKFSKIRVQVPDALSIGGDGELSGSLNTRALLRGEAPLPSDTPIRFDGGIIVNDSAWIDRLHRALGGVFFRRLGGQLAATLELTGTLANPYPKGQLELSGGSLKLSPELPTIESVAGVLRLDGTRFEVAHLEGQLGGERFVMAGHVSLDADSPELDLTLSGKNLLFYRSSGVKLRSDAELRVSGTPEEPRVTGDLRLTDGRFVKRFDFLALGRGGESLGGHRAIQLFSFRDKPLSDIAFDVHITSVEPFRIDNNVVKARLRPDLKLTGSGEFPELVGKLYVDGGKVSLPANDLFLRPGTIAFDRKNSMVPELELLLQNRLRGYEVSVTVNGPYDDSEVTFSSSPPLGPEDLAALIWAGQDPGEGLTSRTGISGAQAVGAYIAQDLLTRLFSDESTESDESFFDRFELFLGRDTTEDGGETIEMTYRMAEEIFGKADTMYLATERDIYAHVNFGVRFVFRFQ